MSDGSTDWINALKRQPEAWATADGRKLAVVALLELTSGDPRPSSEKLQRLRYLYACVAQRSTLVDRQRLFDGVLSKLENTAAAAATFCVIALEERDRVLVMRAALDLALHQAPDANDVLAGPRLLRRFAEDADSDDLTRAGLLSGILMLGDRRVLPLLDGCWELLQPAGRKQLALADAGYLYVSTLTFLLDGLDTCLRTGDHGTFGSIAGALTGAARSGRKVLDIERRFPVWQDDGTPPIRMKQEWTPRAYAAMLEPRLRDLSRREPAPQILLDVLRAWGLATPH